MSEGRTMKMIRWSGIIAFIVIVGLITLFNLLFLDSIIERSLEKQASVVLGARVDIGDLDFDIFDLHLEMNDLQVTNPDRPMRNTLEMKTIVFDLAAVPLLKKKFVIENMTVKDIAFDTDRKTSGALPPRFQRLHKKTQVPKKTPDVTVPAVGRLEECVLPDFSALEALKKRSPEDLLRNAQLKSPEILSKYRGRISETRQLWETRLKELPTKESLASDLKALQKLKDERPTDISVLPAYLKKIKELSDKIDKSKKVLTAAGKEFQSDLHNLKQSLSPAEMAKLKNQDLKAAMAKLNIKIPSAEDLVCVLLGKNIAQNISTAISWYRKFNDYVPAGKAKDAKEKPRQVPRMKGVDVQFPVTNGYPDFLIERAEFSAGPDIKTEPGALAFSKLSGDLKGLTTQPALYGKPAQINLKGAFAYGRAREIVLSGNVDHRKAPADDTFNITIKEMRLWQKESEISQKSPLRLTSAKLNVNSILGIKGEDIEGRVLLVVLNPEIAVGPEAAILTDLFKDAGSFDITVSVAGTLDQPSMKLSSSLTNRLESGLKNIVQKELGGLQNGLKKFISSRIDDDLKDADSDIDNLEKSVTGSISDRIDLTGRILKEASGHETKPTDLLKKKEFSLPFR